LITDNFISVNGENPALHFVDIDADNLLDLVVGVNSGNLLLFEQEATNSRDFNFVTENFSGIDAGTNAAPNSFDFDNVVYLICLLVFHLMEEFNIMSRFHLIPTTLI